MAVAAKVIFVDCKVGGVDVLDMKEGIDVGGARVASGSIGIGFIRVDKFNDFVSSVMR